MRNEGYRRGVTANLESSQAARVRVHRNQSLKHTFYYTNTFSAAGAALRICFTRS